MTFDNNVRTGKIRQHLDSDATLRSCHRKMINKSSNFILLRRNLLLTLDVLVICVTIISFILCVRSLWHGHRLCKEVRAYYSVERRTEQPLTWNELQIFYSYWYFLMIITDLMVISGTIVKVGILFKVKYLLLNHNLCTKKNHFIIR